MVGRQQAEVHRADPPLVRLRPELQQARLRVKGDLDVGQRDHFILVPLQCLARVADRVFGQRGMGFDAEAAEIPTDVSQHCIGRRALVLRPEASSEPLTAVALFDLVHDPAETREVLAVAHTADVDDCRDLAVARHPHHDEEAGAHGVFVGVGVKVAPSVELGLREAEHGRA